MATPTGIAPPRGKPLRASPYASCRDERLTPLPGTSTVWGLALIGVVQEICLARGARRLSLAWYLVMGWVGALPTPQLARALTAGGFAWLAIGGAIYTIGTVFYILDERWPPGHGIWHLFVLGGSMSHFVAVVAYAI